MIINNAYLKKIVMVETGVSMSKKKIAISLIRPMRSLLSRRRKTGKIPRRFKNYTGQNKTANYLFSSNI